MKDKLQGKTTAETDTRFKISSPDKNYSAEFVFIDNEIRLLSFQTAEAEDNSNLREAFLAAYAHWNIMTDIPAYQPPQDDSKKFTGAILGNGPDTRNTFRLKLKQQKIVLDDNRDAEEQILILGTDLADVNWQEWIPYWGQAKIFTQQGFLNYIAGNVADNENGQTVNQILAQCEYFAEGFFRWPHTDVYPSLNPSFNNMSNDVDFPAEGMLNVMGYHVGRTKGVAQSERRQILQKIFEGPLPFVVSADYMAEWGLANHPSRLKKMANCLAAYARNLQNRRDVDVEDAINDYILDLQWLKAEFYDPMSFQFQWPNPTSLS